LPEPVDQVVDKRGFPAAAHADNGDDFAGIKRDFYVPRHARGHGLLVEIGDQALENGLCFFISFHRDKNGLFCPSRQG